MALFTTAHQVAQTVTVPTAPAAALAVTNAEGIIVAASKAIDTDQVFHIPGLIRPMHAWQAAALSYVQGSIARWGGAMVGDDMGLGKTMVALAYAAITRQPGDGPALVVTPPANLGGYQREIRDALPHLNMYVVKGRKPVRIPEGTDIVWMSDDALTMRTWLSAGEVKQKDGTTTLIPSDLAQQVSMYIRDEIHRDKGNMGKPTLRARVSLLVANTLRTLGRPVIGMTGTMLVNRPVEAMIPLRIVGGEALVHAMVPGSHSMGAFLVRYCKGETTAYGTSWGGASNTAELHYRLRATCYVRREKSDIDPAALPHFGWSVVPFAFSATQLRTYKKAQDHLIELIREEKGPDAAFRASRAETIVRMQRLWQEAGKAKAAAAVEYVTDLVDQGDQVVVFYQHQDMFDALLAGFMRARLSDGSRINTGWINGMTQDRRAMEDDFQAGKTQVMLAQLQAAGQAVTLTAARHAVWTQVPFSAGMLAQQRDRIRRCDDISKARAEAGVGVQFHVLQAAFDDGKGTFDMAMWSTLERKAEVIDAVNAGQDVTLPADSIMQETLVEWYNNL